MAATNPRLSWRRVAQGVIARIGPGQLRGLWSDVAGAACDLVMDMITVHECNQDIDVK